MLIKYNHPTPARPKHTPHQPEPIHYGSQPPTTNPDTSKPLNAKELQQCQSILGTVFYCARMIDLTIICASNDLALEQSSATAQSKQHQHALLDYLHVHPDASAQYRTSDMILKAHSDGSYLSVQGGRSRAVGHFYFGDNIYIMQNDKLQGSAYQECSVIKPVVASAAECETATLFLNCQNAIVLHIAAKEMGHPQAAAPMRIDNSTTHNYVCDTTQHNTTQIKGIRHETALAQRSDQSETVRNMLDKW